MLNINVASNLRHNEGVSKYIGLSKPYDVMRFQSLSFTIYGIIHTILARMQ